MSDLLDWSMSVVEGVQALEEGIFKVFDGVPRMIDEKAPLNLPGAWVSLIGGRLALQFGLIAEYATLEQLALRFTGFDLVNEIDVTDAITEVANIVGGVAKRSMISHDPLLTSGLPIFLFGRLVVPSQVDQALIEVPSSAGNVYFATLVQKDA